jgi:phosphoserine phosphatase
MPWLVTNNENLIGSYFYSDSHNDLPLLELVDNPVAINGDPILTAAANENGWTNLDWR